MSLKHCALISVTDKTGVVPFARGLIGLGYTVLSTGGTYRELTEGGLDVVEVADFTGFPEMMSGRLKTLHPKVHGGILARRGAPDDIEAMEAHDMDLIDVVAVNLYPFRETVQRPGASRDDVVENIDIGGPAMLRSAAKNHASVTVVVDPADYEEVLVSLRTDRVTDGMRRDFAAKAFAHTASYDTAIAGWFAREQSERSGARFGPFAGLVGERVQTLRYGENPHQAAAFYRDPDAGTPSLAAARQRNGKELSYNNILDLDAAMHVVLDFEQPTCAVIKHNNPCGVASATDGRRAFQAALAADALSAFGGIVALNVPLTVDIATAMAEEAGFLEAIVAPSVEDGAVEALQAKKWGHNVRVLDLGGMPSRAEQVALRPVSGGFLAQTTRPMYLHDEKQTVTRVQPTDAQLEAMDFAMRVCKHVKSNAILIAAVLDDGTFATAGVGAGQMSRVDSVRIAAEKAGAKAQGAVLASDAFFPFADGLEAAAAAGVAAVIQPGGSKRDAEVIAAADQAGMAMVLTGARHFRH